MRITIANEENNGRGEGRGAEKHKATLNQTKTHQDPQAPEPHFGGVIHLSFMDFVTHIDTYPLVGWRNGSALLSGSSLAGKGSGFESQFDRFFRLVFFSSFTFLAPPVFFGG